MRPEFINRIDEIITFRTLEKDDFEKIAHIMLEDLKKSLEEKNVRLKYTDRVCEYIADKSYSRKFGARNMRRFIETEIEDRLANAIIFENKAPISVASFDIDGNSITLKYL